MEQYAFICPYEAALYLTMVRPAGFVQRGSCIFSNNDRKNGNDARPGRGGGGEKRTNNRRESSMDKNSSSNHINIKQAIWLLRRNKVMYMIVEKSLFPNKKDSMSLAPEKVNENDPLRRTKYHPALRHYQGSPGIHPPKGLLQNH